jgi:hypothetical protein
MLDGTAGPGRLAQPVVALGGVKPPNLVYHFRTHARFAALHTCLQPVSAVLSSRF